VISLSVQPGMEVGKAQPRRGFMRPGQSKPTEAVKSIDLMDLVTNYHRALARCQVRSSRVVLGTMKAPHDESKGSSVAR
jgi:hypothetical protein